MMTCPSSSDVQLGCLSTGLQMDSPVEWTDNSKKSLKEVSPYPAFYIEGSYVKVSVISVAKADWDNGKQYTCKVSNRKLSIPADKSPKVNLVKVSDGESVMCVIEDFFPKDYIVMWRENGQMVSGQNWPAFRKSLGLYSAASLLRVNETAWRNKVQYSCDVTHQSGNIQTSRSFPSKFTVKVNPPMGKELFRNKMAKLECVVTGDKLDVEGAEISWTVGGNPADKRNIAVSPVEQKEERFTKSSWLTIDDSVWFSGTEVKCSTEQDKFSAKIQIKPGDKSCTVRVYRPDEPVPEKVSLLCEVSCSQLGDVYIMWQKDQGVMEEGVMVQKSENPTSVLSLLTVTREEYNKNTIYTCLIKHSNMENHSRPIMASTSKSKFTVKVKPPVVKELFVNNVAKLECVVTGNKLDVEGAEISWTVGGNKADKSKFTISSAEQKDEVFTRSSSLTIDGSVWFKGSEVKCSTEQDKFSDKIQMKSGDKSCSVQINEPREPVTKKVSLLCEVSCSRLGEVYIMWKRNNSDVEEGVMVPVQESGNPTSVFSLLTATGEEYNNTIYTCMVKHTNMENPSTPKTASTAKSKFTVKVKPPQVKELFVNKTAELECVVTGDELEVKEAEIIWTVGGTQADKINITTSPAKQKEKEFTKSSWLTLDESVWFKGSEVKCSTKQSKLSDTIKIKSGATNCSVQVHKPAEPVPDEVSVLCEVRCSPLGDVYIMWRKNDGPIEEGVIVPGPKNESPISVLSVLTVTREEYNTNTIFTCAVKHGGMKNADRPLQANTSKTDPDPKSGSCLYIDENCTLEEDEYNSLWSTASSFIFLFLFSLVYSTILRLSKMK
ncbi:uncharacterized protein [Hoplias malabaricus]|uniref:uncharacterized protein n=1 Tax=Hoplias malabaricus TaxID=27720 RepID=UPI003461F39B